MRDMMTRAFWPALALLTLPVHGAEPAVEPQLELGAGAIALRVPDYRGSDRYDVQVYPIPYVAYRSEHLRVTREGVRAQLFSLDRLTATLSAALNLPGNEDNPDRAGMPRIEPTFEAGPSLDWLLSEGAGGASHWRVRLPVRAAVAADGLDFTSVGWVTVPHVRFDYRERRGDWEVLYLASAGAVWASEDYHEYFYGVAPQFATPDRPAYDAHGGYSGARFNLSGTLQRGRWRYGAFASYDGLGGVVFDDSPLTKTEHSLISGIYVTYRLYASGTGVPLEAD